jgi:hypothetical protein
VAAVMVVVERADKEGRSFKRNEKRRDRRRIMNKSKNGWTRGVRLINHVHFVH